MEASDRAAVRAGSAVDTIVESPGETVGKRLNIEALDALSKSSKDDAPFVGLAIAVRIFEIQDIGTGGDEHTTAIADDSSWPGQVFSENRAFLEVAIVVRIFEQANPAEPLVAAFGIIAHLDDIHPAIFIE